MKIQSTLPPTAASVPLGRLASGLAALLWSNGHRERLEKELRETFQVQYVFLLSSGKAALTLILQGLRRVSGRRKVIIPAYTCFSVPSAVVKAGLEVVPCDVNPETLDFDLEQMARTIDEKTLCVLPTHLFGNPADVDSVLDLCTPQGIIVVEDAAQAMGGVSKGRRLGTIGDIGLFSLGRGKNISSGGGGVIVTNSLPLANAIREEYETLHTESRWKGGKNLLELAATELLIRPKCYWLPAGLPFLGLGETRFYRDFPVEQMSDARAATLRGWSVRLKAANNQRRQQAAKFIQQLIALVPEAKVVTSSESVCLRLPILVYDRTAKCALASRSAALGLGLSGCYPSTIQEIPELQGQLPAREFPGASEVVNRLMTLPTHQFVRPEERERICRAIAEVNAMGAATVPTRTDGPHSSSAMGAVFRT